MCVVVVSRRVRSHGLVVLLRNPDTGDEVWDEWARYASQPSHVRDVHTLTDESCNDFMGHEWRDDFEAERDDRQHVGDGL